MASAKYPVHALGALFLLVLNLAAFFVLLGGAAALQHSRTTVVGLLNEVNELPGSILSFGDLFPQSTNQNFISYEWFKACFQAVTILFALGAIGAGFYYHSRLALIGLFATLAVLFSDASNTFYYLYLQSHKNPLVPSKVKKEITSYFAGCIMSATLNYLLIFTLGWGHDGPIVGHGMGHHGTTGTGAVPTKDTTNGASTV